MSAVISVFQICRFCPFVKIYIMKNLVHVVIVSVISALISVSAYKYFEEPQGVIIREQIPVKYANFSEGQILKSPQRAFL